MATQDAFDLAKFRAMVVGTVMEVLGPDFERAGEQLAERVEASARRFHDACQIKGLTSAEDYQRHMNTVHAAGIRAINECVGHALALMRAARDAGP